MNVYSWLRHQWDRGAAIAATGLGLLLLVLGWVGVSGAKLPSQQIPYLASGGLIGLFLLGIGATLWLSADMRDEWRKLDDIARSVAHIEETVTQSATTMANGHRSPDSDAASSRSRAGGPRRTPAAARSVAP